MINYIQLFGQHESTSLAVDAWGRDLSFREYVHYVDLINSHKPAGGHIRRLRATEYSAISTLCQQQILAQASGISIIPVTNDK